MKVLVVGGTGFIGHHIVRELLAHEHDVTVLVRTPPTNLPAAVTVQLGDLTDLSEERLDTVVAGHRGIIVASAAAVAAPRNADIAAFFHDTNVAPVARLLTAACRARCDRAVILGSFYATLQREQPALRLAELSPYIASRIEQAERARAAVNAETSVAVLELPYVAGTTPGRQSPLEPMLHSMSVGNADILAYPGTTAVVTVTQVAQAAVAALDRRANGNYPIVTANLPWTDLFTRLATAAGRPPKRIWKLPPSAIKLLIRREGIRQRRQGFTIGFHPTQWSNLHATAMNLDPDIARTELGVEPDDLDRALAILTAT
ncbi:NAD-dependent epimerase/dehydratase family protein [Amycolatopsis decaplanina]|uniref:Nucleoside-diphosphate-sugar epimerase n=1 Tax=Amycolatopsis decaplanina DSM 44594 TaxID=1284240 RepID=M2YRA7_9PSEU|nr:NAD-dependent epimerase/dehydratase family protein [Amycolatopsis decaplanina]EME64505.1 nucleoside-diphosphate-sugar epimerase [Amycolatopsis decaplanina DSM 44594]